MASPPKSLKGEEKSGPVSLLLETPQTQKNKATWSGGLDK